MIPAIFWTFITRSVTILLAAKIKTKRTKRVIQWKKKGRNNAINFGCLLGGHGFAYAVSNVPITN